MLLVLWLILVLIASVMPSPETKTELPADKAVHFAIYGFTAILFLRTLEKRIERKRALCFAVGFSTAYGMLMEALQAFIPHRSFSLGDIFANAAGAVVCGVFYARTRRNTERRQHD